jgi:hypothetical protein
MSWTEIFTILPAVAMLATILLLTWRTDWSEQRQPVTKEEDEHDHR